MTPDEIADIEQAALDAQRKSRGTGEVAKQSAYLAKVTQSENLGAQIDGDYASKPHQEEPLNPPPSVGDWTGATRPWMGGFIPVQIHEEAE